MNIHPRDDTAHTYNLFKELFGDIKDKNILDFGGSSGNLLYFSNGEILEENYTCIDVSKESILIGKEEFPKGKFMHFNRYNQMYNSQGNIAEKFPTVEKIDYIWAYSVLSHMALIDIIPTLQWMQSLNPKKIIVSYLNNDGDNASKRVLNYFYEKRLDEYGTCIDFRENKNNFVYLTDNLYGNYNSRHFISIYKTKYLINELAKNNITAKKINFPSTSIPFLEIY